MQPLQKLLFRIKDRHVLVITYVVGVVGMALPLTRAYMLALTPIHLLLTAFLLLHAAEPPVRAWWPWAFAAVLAGYAVELLGVHYHVPFGNYDYQHNLGPHLWQVPPLIGVNWLILLLSSAALTNTWQVARWLRVSATAFVMVGVDYLIEPVAPRMGLWEFWGGVAPPQNYIGWLGVSMVMAGVFHRAVPSYRNRLGALVLVLMVVFFLLLWVLLPA